MKKVVRRLLNRMGVDVVRFREPVSRAADSRALQPPTAAETLDANLKLDERLGFDLETEAESAIQVVRRNTMLSKRRLVTLYEQVAYCERNELAGALVECGVWKGGAVGVMAIANMRLGRERRNLHLFDAFTDICEPDLAVDGDRAAREVAAWADGGVPHGRLQPLAGFYAPIGGHGTLEECRSLLERDVGYDAAHVHYHAGWFQDTVPADHAGIGKIALLRLDGDWYASTKVCLDNLYDHVVPGGIVILDDYGAYEGCRKAVDEFLGMRRLFPLLSPVDSECRYFIKQ